MKCPKCKRDMRRKSAPNNVWYYECPNCFYTIGKPTEEVNNGEENREADRQTEEIPES